jgi:glycyl-tRNA synthetase beta chain
MKNTELLIELGVEEIPAWMLESMASQFSDALLKGLTSERLPALLTAVWYTPRRVIVGLRDIPVRQEDLYETVTGPPRSIAFDASGAPTKAALAFAQKNGITLAKVKTVQTPKGEYLSAVRKIKGRPAKEILEKLIPQSIGGIQFPKTMHWTPDHFRFARPLRWIVALFGGKVLRVTVADVAASAFTVGHRFMGKPKIKVDSLESIRDRLRENGVIVDAAEREQRIRAGLAREASGCGGTMVADESLVKLVVNLNEFPSVIRGNFEERFLQLPKEILVTVMREHQKYFSVQGGDGSLLPVFLAAVNLETADPSKIRTGHERVLRARLADASFFWETDRKATLSSRLESLRSVLFQEKLGSYYDKTQRLLALLPNLAGMAGYADDLNDALTAAEMAKCDLITEMVKEFTDLQGVVGGLYARAEGYPEPVWRAIYEQYLPKSTGDASPASRTGALLALADRLDGVCGCFSAGLIPSGSKDPFAVRRQGNGILKILLDHNIDGSLEKMVDWSLSAFNAVPRETKGELLKFFEGRLRFLFEEASYPYDCVNAALAAGSDSPVDARERVCALQELHTQPDFLSVASNFKRIVNILEKAGTIDAQPDPNLMQEEAEKELWDCYARVEPIVTKAFQARDYRSALSALASMRQAVDNFFDKVLVMAEDAGIRVNRLALLKKLSGLFLAIADISQIVLEK